MLLWLTAAGLLAYFIYIKVSKPLGYWKERGIAYLKPVPILGSSWRIFLKLQSFPDSVKAMYNAFPDKRYFGVFTFSQPGLCIRDLDLIKQGTVKDFDHFTDHLSLFPEQDDSIFSKNLVAMRGQHWREMRSTLSPAFTGSKMRGMFVLMNECAQNFVNYFLTKQDEPVAEVELKDIFTKYTNDVIATTSFGIKCDSLNEPENTFYATGRRLTKFSPWTLFKMVLTTIVPQLVKLLKLRLFPPEIEAFYRDIVVETIKTREEKNIYRPDMINLLMEAKKGGLKHEEEPDSEAGFATVEESHVGKSEKKLQLTDDEMTAQALIFLFAGFETSSTTMSFMMHELALNPDVQSRLHKEIVGVFDKCDGEITYDAVVKMKYLDQVLSETLRKWTPGFQTDRACVKDYVIEPVNPKERPFLVPKGMQLLIPTIGIHYDPKYYPDPEKFDPERFRDENKNSIVPGSYLPFGVGPRNCIGSRFALLEIKVLAVQLLFKFELTVVKRTVIPLQISAKSIFSVAPEGGFWVGMKKRKLTEI